MILKNILAVVYFLTALLFCLNPAYSKPGSKAVCYIDTASTSDFLFRTSVNFLHWYIKNVDHLDSRKIIIGGGDAGNYEIDTLAAALYIIKLKKNNTLSYKFINSVKSHLERCDKHLKAHPQNDFLVPGFENDLILKLMDYEDLRENTNKAQLVSSDITQSSAKLVLQFGDTKVSVTLSRYGRNWQIDNINGDYTSP